MKSVRGELTALIGDLCDYQQEFVEKLAQAVDMKGQYKVSHSQNTADIARKICRELKLNEKTTDLIYYAGLLQNIGKIAVSEKLFNTKGKLSQKELKKIQANTNVGVHFLMNINFLSEVVPYITYRTERVDGSGEPEGLKGQSIPLGSRIIAVADAFSALTSDRPFRKALPVETALSIMKEEVGKKWDVVVVNALAVAVNKDEEIDKALKFLTLQLAQYADEVVIAATVAAYADADVDYVEWVAMDDDRVCQECDERDGKIYPIDKIPSRHWRCRCILLPA